jgi:peptidoglycan/LPS O-acetylase OafA/YrhL
MKGRLVGLDALRGIAALVVALSHFRGTMVGTGIRPATLAVDFFFMLSGYIMARTYEAKMPAPSAFVSLRWKRLFPPLLIGTLIGMASVSPAAWPFVPVALLFLPVPFHGRLFPFNGPAWSLFCEILANFAHAALLARVSTRILAISLIVMLPAWALLIALTGDAGDSIDLLPQAIIRVAFAYSLGILIFRLIGDEPAFRIPPAFALVALPAACLFTPRLAWPIVIALVFPAVLIAGISYRPGRWGHYSGLASYPLYAVNWPIFRLGLPPLLSVLLVACGTAGTVGVERLFRSLQRKRWYGIAPVVSVKRLAVGETNRLHPAVQEEARTSGVLARPD